MAKVSIRLRKIEINGTKIARANRIALAKARKQVAAEIQATIRSAIDTPHPPASTPGSFPHKRSGDLKRLTTVRAEGSKIVTRTPQHGIWLEGGTRKMRARPFIRRVVTRKRWGKRTAKLTKQFSNAKKKG